MREHQKFLIGMAFLAILAVLASFTIKTPKVSAASTNQTNITVGVASIAEITVVPTAFTWNNIVPGTIGGMRYLDIKNSGSQAIQKVYGYVDTLTVESSNPIPAGIVSNFTSGSVLMLKKNETGAAYYYAGRLEWNTTRVEPGIAGPPGSSESGGEDAVVWGYYRNATPGGNFLYYLVNGSTINTTHGCNSSSTVFRIESDPDNGTAASRQPNVQGQNLQTVQDWGIFNFTDTTSPLYGHCVAAYIDCTKIYIYRYDRRNSGGTRFESCIQTDAEQSLYVNTTKALTPGEEFTINLDAWVPEGVPAGWFASSWLTIEAEGAPY